MSTLKQSHNEALMESTELPPVRPALPEFAVALRGYDRQQVDAYVGELIRRLDEEEDSAWDSRDQLARERRESEELRRQVSELQPRSGEESGSVGVVGAGSQGALLLSRAADLAAQLEQQSVQEGAERVEKAEQRATELVELARERAAEVIAAAERHADERETLARQSERSAETAVAQATQQASHEAAVLLDAARSDAERLRGEARQELDRAREQVASQSERLRVESATQAERIEREAAQAAELVRRQALDEALAMRQDATERTQRFHELLTDDLGRLRAAYGALDRESAQLGMHLAEVATRPETNGQAPAAEHPANGNGDGPLIDLSAAETQQVPAIRR